ncbi:MAG TPA: TonB-dependent receptor, partial [Terriglobia bacterium]|nr:TonB-dependent receptor [Terriglobia bacterium]
MPRTIKLTFIFLLLHLAAAYAQTTTGTLVGFVTDQSGASLPGVSVVAIEQDTNRRRAALTDESGNYAITNLSVGIYRVHFQLAGFRGVEIPQLEVRVNESARRDISMQIGPLEQKLVIEADAIGLQTDNSSIGGTIRQDQLQQQLLNGRQLERLAQLFPGMVTAAPNSHLSNRGGFNSVGLDEHYFSFFVDGIDNNDPVIRNFSYRPVIDGVREVKVEESGYNAEFGRNGGAVISVNTRSGSNVLHGSFWEFWRNDNLDARNFFVPSYVDKPATLRNQFGMALNGPLKQDRTFFSIVVEGLLQKTGQARRATVPTDRMRLGDLSEIGGPVIPESQIHPVSREVLDAYPRADRPGITGNRTEIANKIENGYDISIRLDHQLFERTYLMGRYSTNTTRVIDPFRTETSGASNLSGFGQTADRFRTNLGLTLTTVIGDNMVNELRVGYNRFRQPQIPMNRGTPAQVPLMGYLKSFLFYNFFTAEPIGSNAEFERTVNVYNYMDSLAFTRGKHQLKVGVDARRYLVNAYNVGPNAFIFTGARTASSPTTQIPMADFLLGLPTQSVYFDGEPTGNTRKFEFAGYFQDDWKVTPRLTINAGLRWEYYGRITERVNKQSFWTPDCNCMRLAGVDASEGLVDNDLNNFAPRLGFAWRPLDDDTVIRASAGIFYDNDMRHNLEFATNPPFFFTRE